MKILCYSPYIKWQIHAAWEATMLLALQADGASVQYLTCDGAYPVCDLDSPFDPRTPQKCKGCQAEQAAFLAGLPFPFHWLSRYLTKSDRDEVAAWIASLRELPASELETAEFDGRPLHTWVRPSIHVMFRVERIDLANPHLRAAFLAFLAGDALASRALARAFDELEPDLLFVFNGLRASTRIAMEIARERGVRTITHERGPLHERVLLVENDHCIAPEVLPRLWNLWKDVPLDAEQVRTVAAHVEGLATGSAINWVAFSPPPGRAARVVSELQLDPAKPIWSAFTSSLDEVNGEPSYRSETSQDEWLKLTIDFAARHPEIQLVIRQHPNRPLEGKFRPIVERLAPAEIEVQRSLVASLPPNARFVGARSSVSSYDLVDATTLGIAFSSTMSVEMAARGLHVVITGQGPFQPLPFLDGATTREAIERAYQRALALPIRARDLEVARQAHRLLYAWFHRWSLHMPLVEMSNPFMGKFRFRSPGDLARGKDAGLDRLRRIVLEGEPVLPSPTLADRERDDADEVAFFGLPRTNAQRRGSPALAARLEEAASARMAGRET